MPFFNRKGQKNDKIKYNQTRLVTYKTKISS